MKRFSITGLLAALALSITQTALADLDPGRTTLSGPGEAEVIAGTGYEHTLFDSADNKCQHCHNDLYDTWKTSMHAKSWEDPIFQSKYQDFLRLQATKIGASGPTGDYTEDTLKMKSSKVCVKCHAPTAFYSNDHRVTVTTVGVQTTDNTAYTDAKLPVEKGGYEKNLAGPGYNSNAETTVVSMDKSGNVYAVSYSIGHPHNREGINCSYCHSIETVRMFNDVIGEGDSGQYTLASPIKMGPIGPKVREAGETLFYSPDASTPDMNAFFALIGPDIGKDAMDPSKPNVQDTAKDDFATWDVNKKHMGRYVMKSIPTGCEKDKDDECTDRNYYTGGPFYGPFGVTGLSNSRGDDEDATDRAALVKEEFEDAVGEHADKFEDKHQFAAYGKALCLSCHQRSSLMLNPESNGDAGVQAMGKNPDQFLELCSTWTAMSDGVGNNFEDTATSPKCQRCHMEPLERVTVYNPDTKKYDIEKKSDVLHQWDQPGKPFFLEDNPDLTEHFLHPDDPDHPNPTVNVGPVAEGYLNNHAFMGANTADFGTKKIETGFESGVNVTVEKKQKIKVETYLQNKTAHMFPGAHPMRRVLTRLIVTDANDDPLPFRKAKGVSEFNDVTNQLAMLAGNVIKPGFETVDVMYDKGSDVVIQGMSRDLQDVHVSSQKMNQAKVDWVSPDATVKNSAPVCLKYDAGDSTKCVSWGIKGKAQVTKITDNGDTDHFTRIYGRETGQRTPDGTHVVRPGFDSNIATDNRLKPNEREEYEITYDTSDVAWPLTVKYKVYYLKKGANGQFPTCIDGGTEAEPCEVGFLDNAKNKAKKFAISEVFSFSDSVIVE